MGEGLREIELDELPRWSPWPARVLGLSGRAREPRTAASVLREYDQDKYGPLLRAVEADPSLTVEDVKRLELGDPAAPVAMSIGERLYVTGVEDAFRRTTELLVDRVGRRLDGAASIVDLGCGYGYHLAQYARAFPELALSGGEFAPSARELAGRLHGIAVEPLDLVTGDAVTLERAEGPVVVVLSMVLHQLPSAVAAVEAIARHREKVSRVVVYDALEAAQPDGLLGLLRRRYMQLNHYSWDLIEVLERRNDVVLLELEPNAIGPNALLPGSIAVWRFV
jgi:SAM-dependent methyltransferase